MITELVRNESPRIILRLHTNSNNLFFFLTEQEFAKNVIKTAEGAKANVGQQVQLCLLDMYQRKCFSDYHNVSPYVIVIDSYNRVEFVTFLSYIYYRKAV